MPVTNLKRLDSDSSGKAIPFEYVDVNEVTANSYLITSEDAGDIIKFNNASSVSVIIQSDASAPISIGTILTFIQWGNGDVRISPASGVTIYKEPGVSVSSPGIIRTRSKYCKLQFTKIGNDEWICDGYGIYVQENAPSNPQVGDLWFW